MTLTYSGRFNKLLFRWRASVWKACFFDIIVYLIAYYAINLSYRFAMNEQQRRRFEEIAVYVNKSTAYIPLTFLLGFYVSEVMSRWYRSFNHIIWPDSFMVGVLCWFPGDTEEIRIIRRTLARWVNLTSILCWRLVTIRIRKRFPTNKHIVRAGFMTEEEMAILEAIPNKHGNWFVPLTWAVNLLNKLVKEEKLPLHGLRELRESLNEMRGMCGTLLVQDWVVIPLVYTQVVGIACYGYFAICLLGRQLLDEKQKIPGYEIDHYVPIFTMLQFLFYMGWMKVGEDLMRPFGEDDDDFEFNYILDRNTHIAFLYADQLPGVVPKLVKDKYWGIPSPEIPYTTKSLMRPDIVPDINIPGWQLRRINENDDVLEQHEEIEKYMRANAGWSKNPMAYFGQRKRVKALKKSGVIIPIHESGLPLPPKEKEDAKPEPMSTMAADVVGGEVKREGTEVKLAKEKEEQVKMKEKAKHEQIIVNAVEEIDDMM